ncbi:hypothetical protein D3C81_09030 [compost metagenome]
MSDFYCSKCGHKCIEDEELEEFNEDAIVKYYDCEYCDTEYKYSQDRILDKITITII